MKVKSKEDIKNNNFPEFNVALWKYRGEDGALIPLLQSAQNTYGYIPESAINYISKIVKIPPADIYGVITFYSQFRLKPMGKYVIKICNGTACHVNNAKSINQSIQEELGITYDETSEDGMFTYQSVACLGCCSLSPVIMINNETYGRLTPQKVKKILKEYKAKK
ncbi:MAG TPA: NADH-quinone oxidoreductase subunit NuoE [Candidatus Eremiobacteraeota bacterium]|nr:MAG: NADP-reducing hydrogenase subunit HndA [bacterium ADurb.Bin363]HPZ07007.1 NADH-quinone oxidoreductase subunit NuoE [Candidatus Eremiobacteraeota bacterium]